MEKEFREQEKKSQGLEGVSWEQLGYNSMDHMNKILVLLHPLSHIEITKCFDQEPRFNGFFSGDNLPRMKDGGICHKSWWKTR